MTPEDPRPDPAWFLRASGYDASGSIHGLGHTRRVILHAQAIARAEGFAPWEQDAVTWAALWHDIGRTNDGLDYYHGAKSAGKVLALKLHEGLEPRVYETALHAVVHHSGSERHGEVAARRVEIFEHEGGAYRRRTVDPVAVLRVFRALKDADALDRVRLGDLDEHFLRLDSSRARVASAWALLDQMP